jgi:tetratricopeptide (TPR) repeat protein
MQDYNRRFNDNDACWLIKVDTRISGPFSFNEVLAKLTSGEIYSHHEVMQPLDRWRSLVAQPLFAAAVEKLKRQMENTPEQTMTRTERGGITRTLDLHSDRMTPTPFQNTITPPPITNGHPLENNQAPYYGGGYPAYAKKKKNLVPFIVVAAVLVVIAFSLLFFRRESPSAPQKQHSNFIGYVDKGLEAKKVGNWSEALRNFKLARQFDPRDLDLTLELAPLLIQVENYPGNARSMLEKVIAGQYKKEVLSAGKNIMGLSYAYEGQTAPALAMYRYALEADDSFMPAQTNRGLALMMAGKYQDAENQLMQVLTTQADTAIAGLYLLENYVLYGQKSNDNSAYDKALQLANQLVARRIYDGQQEILLLQAYASFKRSGGSSATATAQGVLLKALQVDPDQTTDHLHSPLVDWRGLQWKNFAFICKDLAKYVKGDTLSLLEFVCTYKMGHETEAQQAVELLMNRHLNSPLPHVAQAIVSYRLGEYEKARDSLSLAQKLGAKDKLYLQILIKTCAQLKDSNCIRQNLEKVSAVAPLQATVAKVYERAMSAEERNQVIQVGLRESRNYLPLLKLQ